MGELLRRRMMTKSEKAVKTWDFEWNYTDGLLSDNGWSKEISGTAQELMGETGLVLSSAMYSYIRVYNPDFIVPVGVIETVCSFPGYNSGAGSQNLRICLSNGTNGIQIYENTGYFRLMDNANNPVYGTQILSFDPSQEYTIRLILDGNAYSVFINNSLVHEGSPAPIKYANKTQLISQNGSDALIKSVKLKLNRLV